MPIDAVLKPILDTVLDAVVVMGRDGVIQDWNRHAEEVFGWSSAEAVGRNLGDLIVPPSLREAHRRGLERFNREGVARVLNQRLELIGLRKDGSEIPVELSITLVEGKRGDVFLGFLRDISQRRLAEEQVAFKLRESRLMLDIADRSSGDVDSFDEMLVAVLDGICDLADWPVGHAFMVADDGASLRSSAWSSNASREGQKLVEATEAITFDGGVGLPGRVLESGEALWLSRVEQDANFPRRGLGFSAAFAFPVFSGERCIAVLEFFSRDSREPDEAMLLSARAIGAQVGRLYERNRAEELRQILMRELDHRAKNLLSVVRGIAHLSFGTATDMDQAREAFDRRLDSIAKANAILHAHSGSAAVLPVIIGEALTGCGSVEETVRSGGPALMVDSSTAIIVSLAIHELCTNAFKYGALSVDGGSIQLRWRFAADPGRFDLEWLEQGGPPVSPPSAKGFGMRILERAIELETGGKAEIDYAPEGLRYRLRGARHGGPPEDAAAAA